MTDNEIIKALKLCAFIEKGGCKECPYNSYENCGEMKVFETVDLINRQKAEIERLYKEVDRLSQCVLYHDGQNELEFSKSENEYPCIYKHTCGFDICMLSECPDYEPKTKGKKWFEEEGADNG